MRVIDEKTRRITQQCFNLLDNLREDMDKQGEDDESGMITRDQTHKKILRLGSLQVPVISINNIVIQHFQRKYWQKWSQGKPNLAKIFYQEFYYCQAKQILILMNSNSLKDLFAQSAVMILSINELDVI
ncbi:UNKNOWN [Stylonychia lemnae]|uniref:Uncharacterized protein n=1 Tax=Stylonychia lemnae TaxID=5949 RepID=A0A078AR71_STYLE|nr:UNKNOWN [Stylonychia lemnae]|eukprot:CDW84466.1 UNKNOWN [Stylonychia lemnae]